VRCARQKRAAAARVQATSPVGRCPPQRKVSASSPAFAVDHPAWQGVVATARPRSHAGSRPVQRRDARLRKRRHWRRLAHFRPRVPGPARCPTPPGDSL